MTAFRWVLCALIFTLVSFGPAKASETFLALPSQSTGDANALIAPAKAAIEELGPNDRLIVLDVTDGDLITDIKIADKQRYNRDTFKMKDYGRDIAKVQNYVREANGNPAASPELIQSDIIATLDVIGDLRIDRTQPARALIIANGLHFVPQNASLSMRREDGLITVPNGGFLLGDRSLSPYGIGQDTSYLSGLDVYFCAFLPSSITPHEHDEIARVWAHYIDLRGGQLKAFASDINACISQFETGVDQPIKVRPLKTISPAMVSANMSGRATQVTINRLEELEETIERDKRIAGEKIVDLTDQNTQCAASNRDLKQRLDEETTARKKAEHEVARYREALGQNANGEVTDFSKFTRVPHPHIPTLTIMTGVGYDDGFPGRYDDSWCYFNRDNKAGASVRVDVGNKYHGQSITWDRVSSSILSDIGLSQGDFKAARQSCRFPKS